MQLQPIPLGVAKAVLAQEVHDRRFEEFCCDLVSEVEGGVDVVPTSMSWDRGRDGRSVGGAHRVLVAATCGTNLDPKVKTDVSNVVASKIKFAKLYYCTARSPTSEATLDKACDQLRPLLPSDVNIEALSGEHLGRLRGSYPAPMWKHYRAEVEDIWRSIIGADDSGETQRHSLLLALATAGHENSSAIRTACYEAVLLRALRDTPQTINEVAKAVSDDLGLGRAIPPRVLEERLGLLVTAGLAHAGKPSAWTITEVGRAAVDEHKAEAARQLLDGRRDVRAALEGSLALKLSDSQFEAVWGAVEQKLAHLFYTQGYRIVSIVSGIVSSATSRPDARIDLPFFVDEVAGAAGVATGTSPVSGDIEQAIRDLFAERTSIAYEWMTRVCAAYLTVCTLGLEASSGARLRDAIAQTHLILDTDVVLTLFGVGEPEHEAAEGVVREWRRLGGTLLLARPVAEEVAYHAHIAERDYEEGRQFLASENLRSRFLRNVFTRSFGALMEHKGARGNGWHRYIAQYQGGQPYDATNIRRVLREDFGFRELPDVSVDDEPARTAWLMFQRQVEARNVKARKQKELLDKAQRDARLYGAMLTYAEALLDAGRADASVLVTSSGRLQSMGDRIDGEGTWTLSLAEVSYLLSMVPGVTVGLSGLKALLFDGRLSTKRKELDLLILRTLHDAGYEYPGAQRGTLVRSVRRSLIDRAKDTGEAQLLPTNIVRSARTDDGARTALATAIASALTATDAEGPMERENELLRKKVRDLEERLRKRG